MMKNLWIIFSIGMMLVSCNPEDDIIGSEDIPIPPDHGFVEVEFLIPEYKRIPEQNIHRVSLGFAYTVDSLYRGEFFRKVNVSDYQKLYKITLPSGEYYYEAVITCSCDGDTCLNGGFPGGKFGMKYDFLDFTVQNQQITNIKVNFR
ncbi:MAG: hypothetical protein U9N86_16050 [Bacteroidota bacterium]|nr:hypothetical protein [Bacteroidota bacterium]